MTKKNPLKWRLGKLPSVNELDILVRAEMLTKDEAREILFSQEAEEEQDKKSLKSEIKFLRELVDTLSKGRTDVVVKEITRYKEPYYRYEWYKPYYGIAVGQNMQNIAYTNALNTTSTLNAGALSAGGVTNSINLSSLK